MSRKYSFGALTRRWVELRLGQDKVTVGRDPGAVGNPEFLGIVAIIGEKPTAEVDYGGRGVVNLDGVSRQRARIAQDLVDHDWRHLGLGTIVQAGTTVDRRAHPPARGIVPVPEWILDDKREPIPIGQRVPVIAISKIQDGFLQGSDQG